MYIAIIYINRSATSVLKKKSVISAVRGEMGALDINEVQRIMQGIESELDTHLLDEHQSFLHSTYRSGFENQVDAYQMPFASMSSSELESNDHFSFDNDGHFVGKNFLKMDLNGQFSGEPYEPGSEYTNAAGDSVWNATNLHSSGKIKVFL